jgi:8-oxo-dGTP diphosphatase
MIKDCHVGVKGVIRVGDKCLVLRRNDGTLTYWDAPGGRVDDDESLTETLTRELSEELPCLKNYQIGKVVDAYRLGKNIKDGRGLVFIFYRVDAEPFEVELTDVHEGYVWVTKDDVSQLLTSEPNIEQGYYDAIVAALD